MKTSKAEKENLVPVQEAEKSARAVLKYVRVAPRKVRLVINAVRNRQTEQAFHILMTLKQKGARLTEKLLKSAVANAKVLGMDENRLFISDIRADGGPSMKRFMQRSMGRADRLLIRTTHLSIILKEGRKSSGASRPEAVTEAQKGTEKIKSGKAATGRKKAAAAGAR